MARINTNVPALVAQRHLMRSQRELELSLERLSSGLRINRGSDDPAGLIVSENLRSDIAGVGQAIENSERAIHIIAICQLRYPGPQRPFDIGCLPADRRAPSADWLKPASCPTRVQQLSQDR